MFVGTFWQPDLTGSYQDLAHIGGVPGHWVGLEFLCTEVKELCRLWAAGSGMNKLPLYHSLTQM